MFIFQNVATWTVVHMALANLVTVLAMRVGMAACVTSRPATTGAQLMDPVPTAPVSAQTVIHLRSFKNVTQI